MKIETLKCDIDDLKHDGDVLHKDLFVMFDHDQEDAKSTMKPYFQNIKLDICESCFEYMTKNRRIVYAYGAMGYNKYYLKK